MSGDRVRLAVTLFVRCDGCEQDERRAARIEDLASARQIGFVSVDIVRAENDEVVVDLIRGGRMA